MASSSKPSDEDGHLRDFFLGFVVLLFFAAGVAVAMFESEGNARERRTAVWS